MLLIASCLTGVYKASGLLNPLGIRKSKDKSNKIKMKNVQLDLK